jgi:putative ABC transport system permease protein
MKYLPFVFKHLRRNWIRTTSTVLGMALCIFLFCTLQSVLFEINAMLDSTSASRLVTRHAVSLNFPLPLAYRARMETIPGVKRVATAAWFGGMLPEKKEGKAEAGGSSTTDWSRFVPSLAVEPEPYFAMYPEYQVPPDQWKSFLADRRGCVIGRRMSEKYGWKVGDHFFLESFIPPYRKPDGPFEFVVQAIFDVDTVKHPGSQTNMMFFHYSYLYEATGRWIQAGIYNIEIDDPSRAAAMSRAIDETFANSDAQTYTETEKAFVAGFISMAGNLALLLNGIALAVSFTILLVTANTMSMAVRERRTEVGVLKTLGFSSAQVMGLIVGEALLIGVLGGGLGVLGSQGVVWMATHIPNFRDAVESVGLGELRVQPVVAALGFGAALVLGFAAGFVPALNAYRAKITDALRTV